MAPTCSIPVLDFELVSVMHIFHALFNDPNSVHISFTLVYRAHRMYDLTGDSDQESFVVPAAFTGHPLA